VAGRRSTTSSSTPTRGRSPRSSRRRGSPLPSEALTSAAPAATARRRALSPGIGPTHPLSLGVATLWLSIVVLIPLAAVVARSTDAGLGAFVDAVTARQAVAALKLTLVLSIAVAAINAVAGTLVAWVLVRDRFRGRGVVNALIDLPFALPTIVAGITLLALYGPNSPSGVNVVGTRWAIAMALLFVTLPFVVRSVQPVLMELDREMEEAAVSLGAGSATVFRRIVLPNLAPAILSGAALGFARAVGEFGSVVLIAGNLPFRTEVASVFIYGRIESDAVTSAAAVSVVLLALSLLVLMAIRALARLGHGR
jgi:sulfate/thiosulfate transport system permease protein